MIPPSRVCRMTTTLQQRTIHTHVLSNQMVLVGEPTDSVQSAAFTLLIPSGSSTDSVDRHGLSSMLCDMVLRGAGARDSRALINDLEVLGVERGESVGVSQTSFSATWESGFLRYPIVMKITCKLGQPLECSAVA